MKRYVSKIFVGIFSFVLICGCFAVKNPLIVKASAFELNVVVKDTEGKAVEGVWLVLANEEFGDLEFEDETDEKGRAVFEPLDVVPGAIYYLQPAEDSGYICNNPIEVVCGRGYFGKYIDTVDGEPYYGDEVKLVVESSGGDVPSRPNIDTVIPSVNEVSRDGQNIGITVEGTNLPEDMYYELWYTMKNGGEVRVGSANLVSTEKIDAQKRMFNIDIPSVSEYPEAVEWRVKVALSADDYWTVASIKIAP